jgi:glycosyltransferase involved in cell wall biosynthesis
MKIAFFSDSYLPQINGVVQSIKLYREELQKLGHTVYVFAPKYPHHKETDPEIFRYSSIPFAFYKEYRVTSPLSIRNDRMIREMDLDLIHSHSPFSMGLLAENYATRKKIPHVYTHHTLWSEYIGYIPGMKIPGLNKRAAASADRLAAIFCNRTDQIISPSKKIELLLRKYGTSKPIEILPTGIRLEDFEGGDPQSFRRKFRIPDSKQVVLYMGRIGIEKDIDFVIKSFARLQKTRPATHLVIVGDGPHMESLKELVESLEITEDVTFTGYQSGDDRTSAYKSADIFCFTSKSETQGLVLLEADACRLPLGVTHDLAFDDVAIDGYNAVVTPHNEKRYVEAIADLLEDKARLTKFQKNSRELAEKFTAQGQAKKLITLYTSVIEQHNRVEA